LGDYKYVGKQTKKETIMNTNTETTVTTTEQQTDAVTTEATAAATEPTQQIENGATDTQDVQATTYSEEEVAKRIQSEADKVRTKYVEKVKALEAKLAELSPTLTPAEIEMRERLEALEAQQAEVARKEAFLDLQTK
jgi:methanogenic corrinoid protein MtbC1